MHLGFDISEIVYGDCKYSDKLIIIESEEAVSWIEDYAKKGLYPADRIGKFVFDQVENHIFMNKPNSFAYEKEFRVVWKLVSKISDMREKEDLKIIKKDDGVAFIITAPELVPLCERI